MSTEVYINYALNELKRNGKTDRQLIHNFAFYWMVIATILTISENSKQKQSNSCAV